MIAHPSGWAVFSNWDDRVFSEYHFLDVRMAVQAAYTYRIHGKEDKQKELLEVAALLIGIAANLITIAEALQRSKKPRKNRAKPRKRKR